MSWLYDAGSAGTVVLMALEFHIATDSRLLQIEAEVTADSG